jgi:cyclophilin family peptidyl-prolyl cis-trans isomerase
MVTYWNKGSPSKFTEKIMLRLLLGLSLCYPVTLFAADPPAPAKGPKAREFESINKEWTDLIAGLLSMKIDYATADAAKKAEIYKQYNAGLEKAKVMEGKLVAAAEAAFLEAPNSDANVTQVLVGTLFEFVKNDDYEPAFPLAKLLMDNKCNAHELAALAGVAAYCTNEYDLAERWLQTASANGGMEIVCKYLPKRHYADYLQALGDTKLAWDKEKKLREAEAKANDLPRVLLKTSAGDIEVELFENEAPNTVLNFITLVDKGFYNNVKFHRVLPGFMAQGGDPQGDGKGGPGYTIPGEVQHPNHRAHFRGSLSMANTGHPDTGGSQFFICFKPTTYLNGKHTVFGRVISGMDVLAKIKRRDPDEQNVGPADTIIEANVTRQRKHPYDAKDVKKSNTGG